MFKPISVAIGLRYLRAKRRNGFISFISLASILGIAIGVAALITTLAVMSGFQREIRDRMLQMAAHATVSSDGAMDDWQLAVDEARKDKRVAGAAPYIEVPAMLAGPRTEGALVRAVIPAEEGKVSVIADRMVQNYVGVTDAAWNNPGKGKELAMAQIGKDADVIFTAAGNSGLGVFDAVEQAGTEGGRARRLVIGVDSNQNGVKPGFVLTSMVKRVDNAVYDIVSEVAAGRFAGGFHVYGLDGDGVGYSMDEFNRSLVSADMLAAAERAKRRILAGEIVVTDAMAQ